MWETSWRDKIWSTLEQPWDILIIGGGITGAGILREAARLGLRVLLVERRDFGWGTSSRSSKLVHGGLRYLKEGKIGLTRASVRERDRLLEEGAGLIDPMGFLLATYKGDRPGRWTYQTGLAIYDLLALQWTHQYYSPQDFEMLAPHLAQKGLKGGLCYGDAQTDDARLVLRLIQEAAAEGGVALNYVAAQELLFDETGQKATGARLQDMEQNRSANAYARVVINATGAWADAVRRQMNASSRLRPLRGSHLIFPAWRLPAAQAISFLHPIDRRPVFIFPWEGITLVGTTDLDHDQPLDDEPRISAREVAYLMAAVEAEFPSLRLTLDDVLATFSGVRPVINTGQTDPSKESRDHVIWEERGLLTVTGGKLTTFRLIALDALKAARRYVPNMPPAVSAAPVLNPAIMPEINHPDKTLRRRLMGHYGKDASALIAAAFPGELEPIPGAKTLWAELRWAARAEGVVHLDDLLLRRVRLGLLLPEGGKAFLPAIRAICQPELGWDDAKWQKEESAYLALWNACYSLPAPENIPDWRTMLAQAKTSREAKQVKQRRTLVARTLWAAAAITKLALAIAALFFWRRRKQNRQISKPPGSG
ncbi:MAG: glycerol-3-phosphate dehydrogenase/oxidase [Smithellaceae bacterium]|nr:glycerol-3-phosphate dehydrogenase/oxidase [Smithellaceae bacterium]